MKEEEGGTTEGECMSAQRRTYTTCDTAATQLRQLCDFQGELPLLSANTLKTGGEERGDR